jgi:salicylate hydroxylase
MSPVTSIVVIGAGISGLAAAIALAKKGHPVLVVERRPAFEESGAGIQLSPNASHILIRLGLGGALARTAVAPKTLMIRRWGEPRFYAQMPMDDHSTENQGDGSPFWAILRQDLHAALLEAAQRNPLITIHQGWELERIQDQGKTTRLTFNISGNASQSRQILDASCVLGADGQSSALRRLLGDARDLDTPGWEAWRTLVPAEKTQDFIRAAATNLWLGKEAHAVHYPVSRGQFVNLVVIRKSSRKSDGWGAIGDPASLADIRSTAAPTLRDLINLAPQWNVWTLHDRQPSPFMAKGRFALLGDCAHPILPFLAQGGALAIEDAAVLAHSLPGPDNFTPDAITMGLKRYAASRMPRVKRVYKAARSNAITYHLPPFLAWFRDRRMMSIGPEGMKQRYDWLYGWRSPD